MDTGYVASAGIRSQVVDERALSKFKRRDGLIIGIVKEAEASASKLYSLIHIQTGKDQSILLLMKNNAGFLIGSLVIYDQLNKKVSWIENDIYTFNVIARLKPRPVRPASLAAPVNCPECGSKTSAGAISEHLKRAHWFPRAMSLDKFSDGSAPVKHMGNPTPSTRANTTMLSRICPEPARWNELFSELVEYAKVHPCNPSRPPIPLILGGWTGSNDAEKSQRWKETVDWASANGCLSIVARIPDQDFYRADGQTNYSFGPLGAPCFRPWDYERKVRPSDEALSEHLEYLTVHWTEVAGPALSTVTCAVAFTGKKARRLLVAAKNTAAAPWGEWSLRSEDESKRRTFTYFRAAVNRAISPHEVDHIAFVTNAEEAAGRQESARVGGKNGRDSK